MTSVKFVKVDDVIMEITVSGHANAADPGEDMVCSAISAFSFMTANNIYKFKKENYVNIKIAEGYFAIEVLKSDNTVQLLLESLLEHLSGVERDYPDFIKLGG